MSDNVLSFPKEKIVREGLQNIEQMEKLKTKSTVNFAESLTSEIATNIFSDFSNYGIDTETEKFKKDCHFLLTILNATIYRCLNLQHPLHEFIDDQVVVDDNEKDELDSH